MRFTVGSEPGLRPANLPELLNPSLVVFPSLNNTSKVRRLTLFESIDETTESPLEGLINGNLWSSPISELPYLGSTEDIEWINLTGDAHPLHLHLVSFQIVSRQPFDADGYTAEWTGRNGNPPFVSRIPLEVDPSPFLTGEAREAEPSEQGWVDTVIVYPGEVTRIRARFVPRSGGSYPFDATAEPGYVLHCHILDHEDNEMMRPMKVVASPCQSELYAPCLVELTNPCCTSERFCARHSATECRNMTTQDQWICVPRVSVHVHE
jgi:spore coat protein A